MDTNEHTELGDSSQSPNRNESPNSLWIPMSIQN